MWILSDSFKFTYLKALAGGVRLVMQQRTDGILCKWIGSVELPEEPAMDSVGPCRRGSTCSIGSSSCIDASNIEGELCALFGDCPTVDRTCHLLGLVDRVLEGGRVNLSAPWTPVDTRFTTWLAEVLKVISSTWSPSHSRWAAYLFSSASSLSFHNAYK